jgi:hypothetical protein
MPRAQSDEGIKPYEIRPGVSVARFKGMNRSEDPAGMPANAHHLLVNARLGGGEITERPGSTESEDSGSSICIRGIIETGARQPAANLWHYSNPMYYYREVGATPDVYEGRFAAIDFDLPLSVPDSPIAVLFTDKGTAPSTTSSVDKVRWDLFDHSFSQRGRGAFMFQDKLCRITANELRQITDIKRDLNDDLSTGAEQFLENIPNDAGYDVVVRTEFDGTNLLEVLYTPSTNAGALIRYDGTTVTEVATTATVALVSLCLMLGQALCAIGNGEVVYQSDPDASWVKASHSYSDVYDVADWAGIAYFVGENANSGPGTDLLKYTPGGSVAVVDAGTAGSGGGGGEFFCRLAPHRDGLYFFRCKESNGVSRFAYIGRLTPSLDLTYAEIGFMQDFSPVQFSLVASLGGRLFYALDATEEFGVLPPGYPHNNLGVINEVLGPTSWTTYYKEWYDADDLVQCPTAVMPIGPFESIE